MNFFLTKKYYLLYIVMFVVVLLISVSRINYYLYGDTAIYYMDYLKLRGGYFHDNLSALFSGNYSHVTLSTEGGWTYVLYWSSLICPNMPYILATLLFPVALAALLVLCALNNRNSKFVHVGAISVLVLLCLSTTFSSCLWLLTNPFRDISGHIFTFVALIFATCVLNCFNRPRREKCLVYLFFCGFVLGLSAWFRLPNVMVLVPVSLIFLFRFLKSETMKYNIKSGVLFLFAVVIGLLPIVGQNILEGRRICDVGQMDLMVVNPSCLPQHSHLNPTTEEVFELSENNVVCGLHLQNFKYTFPKVVKTLIRHVYGEKLFVLYLILILIGLFRNTERSILFVSCSLMLLLFYSFYDKYVDRYMILHVVFFMVSVEVGVVALLDIIAKYIKFFNNKIMIYMLCVVLSVIFLFMSMGYRGSLADISEQRKIMSDYKERMSCFVDKGDLVFNTPFKTWTQESITDESYYWPWGGLNMKETRDPFFYSMSNRLNQVFCSGKDAYVLQPTKDGKYCQNWKMNDIELSYSTELITNVYSCERFDLSLFRILPHKRSVFRDSIDVLGSNLVIWCEDSNRTGIFPCDILFQSDFGVKTNLVLNAGFNVFPKLMKESNGLVNVEIITLNDCLPGVITFRSFKDSIEFDLRDYTLGSVIERTFENCYVEWKGYSNWKRDSMFLKSNERRKVDVFTSVLVTKRCDIPISFGTDSNNGINLYVSINNVDDSADMNSIHHRFKFMINDQKVVPKVTIDKTRKHKIYYNLNFDAPEEGVCTLSVVPIKEQAITIYKIGFRTADVH